jgi:hypothetical protein
MSKLSTNVEALHRVVAMLVAVAVLAWSVGAYTSAQAANLIEISNTLSDSDISAVSNHTLQFEIPAGSPGVAAGGTISVTFPAGFVMGSVAFADMDLNIASSEQTLAAAPSGATWGAVVSGQTVTFTSGSGTAVAGNVVIIRIGTNATTGGTGVNQVTNPGTDGSYEFYVTAGVADTGRTRVAILDNVLVTAQVPTIFEFTVAGVDVTEGVNGTTTTGSTTATTIPFGVLTPGGIKTLAQDLTVQTNAANGFVVTVEQDDDLKSSTDAVIDGFIDGAYTNTPVAWQAPANNVLLDNTWGHWGLTSDDSDLNTDEFGTNLWVAASTTPRQVFSHTGPADGTTQDIGIARVGYQIQITALQEAGDDYQTILTYIATPTF